MSPVQQSKERPVILKSALTGFARKFPDAVRAAHMALARLALVLMGSLACVLVSGRAASNTPPTVYLFATFKEPEQDGLRFTYSYDGFHWTNINGLFLRARVGGGIMRDPSIVRGPDGRFHMVWTSAWRGDRGFGYACSHDLVHWSEQRFIPVMDHEPDTCNTWAPELFYDETADRFIIVWASTIPGRFALGVEAPTNNHRLFYTTTRDFKVFTPTKLFFDPGYSVIDGFIVRTETNYVLVFKDNTRPQRNLRVAFSDSPVGPWTNVSEPLTAHLTEGPCVVRIGQDWIIYYDAYGQQRYGALSTRDFRTFRDVTDQMQFPRGLKHGTVLTVTEKELRYLLRVAAEQVPGVRLPMAGRVDHDERLRRLAAITNVAMRGPFKPDWDSIVGGFKVPRWYQDAKLGIFIHWGVYSVPAFGNEWYPRNMYRPGTPEHAHHLQTYGPLTNFGYKDFVPQFRAERFDPNAWARLFKDAGARYVVPVAEHHDGFAMFRTDYSEWNAAEKGPHRDVIADLARACRKAGLVFGVSSHRAEHWWFFDAGLYVPSDVHDPANAGLYGPASNRRTAENQTEPPDEEFLQDWLLRSCELVDRFRPAVVYFDWWICQPAFQPYLKLFAAYYYNRAAEWGIEPAINFKEWEGRSFPPGAGVLDIERGATPDIRAELWQACTSVSRTSWGYVTNHNYKSATELIHELVDIVSKNGTMLLNIGPRPDGTIPEPEADLLRELGRWLRINGPAIYGTRQWHIFGEGPTASRSGPFTDAHRLAFTPSDFRFTTKGNRLYVIMLAWPQDGTVRVHALRRSSPYMQGEIRRVRLLGAGPVNWSRTTAALEVSLPERKPCNHAWVLECTLVQPHASSTDN